MRKAKRHCLTSKVLSSRTEEAMKKKVWIFKLSKAALLLDQERLVPHATRSTATLPPSRTEDVTWPFSGSCNSSIGKMNRNKYNKLRKNTRRFYLAEDSPHPSFRYKSSPAHSQISCRANFRNAFSCKNPW